MLKYKIMYAAALIAAVAAFMYINTLLSLLMVVMLVAIPVFIRISVSDNANKINMSCNMVNACVVGKETKPLTITVQNKSKLPMGSIEVVILYRNHMFSEEHEEKITLCGQGRNQIYNIPLNNEKCGRSSIEIREAYCCDMFNITRSRLKFRYKNNYTVYPPLPEVQIHAEKLLNA